jgi:beta-galactosidase
MHRRDFLKATGGLIASATLARPGFAGTASEGSTAAGRLTIPMNRNWRYNRTVAEGAHARDFDDSGYEHVVIPHTNVKLPWHGFD